MSATATKLRTKPMDPKMVQFYAVLGSFNFSAISRIISDPTSIDLMIQRIRDAGCIIHDAECPEGCVYDHEHRMCIIIPGGNDPH